MPIKDIENHLERADARIERFEKIEAVREREAAFVETIRLTVGIIAALCALFAVYQQFSCSIENFRKGKVKKVKKVNH